MGKQAVQTPGANTAAPANEDPNAAAAGAPAAATETDSEKIARLEALVEGLAGQVRTLNTRGPQPQAPVELPKYDDVMKQHDAGELKAPVLTDKGYVVPADYQARPDLRK